MEAVCDTVFHSTAFHPFPQNRPAIVAHGSKILKSSFHNGMPFALVEGMVGSGLGGISVHIDAQHDMCAHTGDRRSHTVQRLLVDWDLPFGEKEAWN